MITSCPQFALLLKLLHQMQSGGTHRMASGSNSRSSPCIKVLNCKYEFLTRAHCHQAARVVLVHHGSCGNVFHHVSDVIWRWQFGAPDWRHSVVAALFFFQALACCSTVCKFADSEVCQPENLGRLPVNTVGGGELTGPNLCISILWFGPIARCSICRGR